MSVAGHSRSHSMDDDDDHALGSMPSNSVLGNIAGTLGTKSFAEAATVSTLAARRSDGTIKIVDGVNPDEATSKLQMEDAIDAAVTANIKWKNPVDAYRVIDDLDKGGIDPAGPFDGDTYVVNNWASQTDGDIVTWDEGGGSWNVEVTNSGGEVPGGTRFTIAGGTPGGTFAAKDGQIATADGLGAYTYQVPVDGWTVSNDNDDSLYFKQIRTHNIEDLEWFRSIAIMAHNDATGMQGGDAGASPPEHYHLSSSQHTELIRYKADVTLAGASPVKTDMTGASWAAGDRGIGVGTDGTIWLMHYDGTDGYAVQLTVVPAS